MGVLVILLFISASVLVEACTSVPKVENRGIEINIDVTDDDRNFIRSIVTEIQRLIEEKRKEFFKANKAEDEEVPSDEEEFQENLDDENFSSTLIETELSGSTEAPPPTTTTDYDNVIPK
ncbi:uncharacterized protein LOC119080111 [Bradysia coprophila]|uniref:uncharacterized protein LOC119080111 n=1 Tax=Bradysia coprophila TaxID=38358 RepID=UPI00187DB784|nr:uncharacterized protein LOC119080111 [Bradysia coprophila]